MNNKEDLPRSLSPREFSKDTPADHMTPALQSALWQLLSRQVRLYTMDDSSSVRVETFTELLSSVRFLLSHQAGEAGVSLSELLGDNPEEALTQSIRRLERKTEEGRQLYKTICLELPEVENCFFQDTLKELHAFFIRYDFRYFAHQIPCAIDYPLCLSVPESKEGICYIMEYLLRLSYENQFLRLFPAEEVKQLLTSAYSDYRESPLNLCAPVLTNAVGLTLLDRPSLPLGMGPGEKSKLLERLSGLSSAQLETTLRRAAVLLWDSLSIQSDKMRAYLTLVVLSLSAHLSLGLKLGHLDGLFFSC